MAHSDTTVDSRSAEATTSLVQASKTDSDKQTSSRISSAESVSKEKVNIGFEVSFTIPLLGKFPLTQ